MKKIIRYSFVIALIFGGLILIANQAFLYSGEPTHSALTREVALFYNHYYDPDITPEQIEWMRSGSIKEDTWPRNWYYHFYDPVCNQGLGSLSAKEWAQAPEAQARVLGGDHTWQKAISDYNAGYKKQAFISLGHVLHLIEDMAVPAHTRQDLHRDGDSLEEWAKKLSLDSVFYDIANPLIGQKAKPKILNNLDAYFDVMANFSNNNFFSQDTIEDTINRYGRTKKDAKYFDPKIVAERWENGKKYAYGKVVNSSRLIKLAQIRYNTSGEKEYYIYDEYTKEDSPEVHADYFSLLAREAVINGTGVVKLFFNSVIEPDEEIFESERKLSFWQKIGNKIKAGTKFLISVFDGLFHLPSHAVESLVKDVMPDTEYLTTNPWITEKIMEDLENAENAEDEEETKPPIPPDGGFVSSSSDTNKEQSDKLIKAQSETFLIEEVIDGDTVVLASGQKVRFIGIDAPEFPNACFSQESFNKNKELLEGKQVRLEKDVSEKDSYSRLLRYVYLDSLFVNDYLVRNGYAYDWAYKPDTKYEQQLADAEKEAKENNRGLWGEVCHASVKQDIKRVVYSSRGGSVIEEQPIEQPIEQPQETEDSIVINEIAWMGTKADHNDEWIELYNIDNYDIDLTGWTLEAEDGTPTINLTATISANEYFLLERTDDQAISNIKADQIYTGSLGNIGEHLILRDKAGNIIDEVVCSEGWCAGENKKQDDLWSRRTMERTVSGSWQTYNGVGFEAVDVDGNMILGTPKSENSEKQSEEEEDEGGEESEESGGPTVINSHITEDTTWTLENSPYLIYDNDGNSNELLEIFKGVTVTIEPGVIVKFANPGLKAFGTIKADGTSEQPIIFTNYNDDSYGGDIFGEEDDSQFCSVNTQSIKCPQPGDWSGIWLTKTSLNSILDNVIVRYAGSKTRPLRSGSSYSPLAVGAAIRIEDASAVVKNSIIEHNLFKGLWLINSENSIIENTVFKNNLEYDGLSQSKFAWERNMAIYIDSSNPQIQNSTFQNNLTGIYAINKSQPIIKNNNFSDNSYPVWIEDSYPSFSGNQIINNNWNGIVLRRIKFDRDYTLKADSPFINYDDPFDSIIVLENHILTIAPGTIIKSVNNTSGFEIRGSLIAEGTIQEPIIFTSFYDDEHGGDTNGDGEASQNNAKAGSWGQIVFTSTSTNSFLNHVVIRYGGMKWLEAPTYQIEDYVLVAEGSDITLINSTIENNTAGFYLNNSNSQISNTIFRNHQYSRPFYYFTSTGIHLNSSTAKIDSSTFSNNKLGIWIDLASLPSLIDLIFGGNNTDVKDLRSDDEL